ncbi:MAG TPA: SpoIID/LytB domain-containing protein, partial [Longimicrobiales bacterium]|nr:SpoIID/LytB domain-containing protein [Longimicrobiales bacterium]
MPAWAVVVVTAACARGEVIPPTPEPSAAEPTVRIGLLVDTPSVDVSATSAYEILNSAGAVQASGNAGEVWTFTVDGERIRARQASGRELDLLEPPIRIVPRDPGLVNIGGRNYRGSAFLRIASTGKLSAINQVEIEEYLRGVVPYEIGRLAPELIEAVKAQAVAARTYAIGNLNRWGDRGFDFVATVQDQVYGGVSGEDSVASRAVRETAGHIVTYQGKPILAYYSSTCGGRTARLEDSWSWRPGLPYLQSVSDTIPGTDRAYCDTSSRYRWNVSWTREALRAVLERTLTDRMNSPIRVGRISNIELTGRNESGRARALRIDTEQGTHSIPSDSIRWVLRPDSARSLNSSLLLDLHADVDN